MAQEANKLSSYVELVQSRNSEDVFVQSLLVKSALCGQTRNACANAVSLMKRIRSIDNLFETTKTVHMCGPNSRTTASADLPVTLAIPASLSCLWTGDGFPN